MATLDEVFAAMDDPAADGSNAIFYIDPDTRQIEVPASEAVFGVTSDAKAERKYFACPRYVGGGVDLAACFLRVNYRNANGEIDAYLVEDLAVSGEMVTFSWELSRKVTKYKGEVEFVVCACYPNATGHIVNEWHTTLASGNVLEGLEVDTTVVELATADVIAQLLALVDARCADVKAEGTAQVEAVQAEGAAQVAAVETAAAAAQAAAVSQIEAKGAATLATIPEDYTALAGKVNEQANAIKGNATGEIIRVDDVSPVEHYPAIRVLPRNLFDISRISTTTDTASAYISEVGDDYLIITTKDDYTSGGYKTTGKKLREICPLLQAGKTYFLSGSTESVVNPIVYIGESWKFGTAKTITEAMLEYHLIFYGLSATAGEGTGNCTISNIQIEEGDTATEYTPYVAPETVTVTRCGKNLFDLGTIDNYHKVSEQTVITDGVIYGYVNSSNASHCINLKNKYPHGNYAISYTYSDTTPRMLLRLHDIDGNVVTECAELKAAGFQFNTSYNAFFANIDTTVVTIPETVAYWCLGFAFPTNENTVMGDIVEVTDIQVELSDAVTAFEVFNGAMAMLAEDGTVGGLTSTAPTMTLLTDTPGVIVECEYNRDTNMVIQRLIAAIQALGGTV